MRVAVYGSGGHGKVVADILQAEGRHELIAHLDDDPSKHGARIGSVPVRMAGDRLADVVEELRLEAVALGIGDNVARSQIAGRCRAAGLQLLRAIHPRSVLASSVEIGEGVVVMAGAVVNPFSSLKEGCVVNTSASVDHDCVVGRYAHVFPGARLAGTVSVGDFSYVGMGASVLQNRTIGTRATVGAGAVVLADVGDGWTVVGVPARRIKP